MIQLGNFRSYQMASQLYKDCTTLKLPTMSETNSACISERALNLAGRQCKAHIERT